MRVDSKAYKRYQMLCEVVWFGCGARSGAFSVR